MEKYILQPSEIRSGYWVCTDIENGFVCIFKEKEFDQSQQNTLLNDIEKPDVIILAKWAQKMGDWLMKNHKDIL